MKTNIYDAAHFAALLLLLALPASCMTHCGDKTNETIEQKPPGELPDVFPRITDEELLDKVQQQTFGYFWDYAHPVSGLARERTGSGDLVTSGGSGFGIMSIVVAVERGFITRDQGLERMEKITAFLGQSADRFHGAYSHWFNGQSGMVIPFSSADNGADLVETAYLVQGLLTAREYFDADNAREKALRESISALCDAVEWNWFTRGGEKRLYWHWSPTNENGWVMNMPVSGWNECLIVYVLAAGSERYAIDKATYDQGWAGDGGMLNGQSYYGITLPLGPAWGGPLFFAHYSFLGLDPRGLEDSWADYWEQNVAHARINHAYCADNPKGKIGYTTSCWGLTACDIPDGYSACSPANDLGVIAPTAALSSMPYTPEESMAALHYFYYKLGGRLWRDYGFCDSFSLQEVWYAPSHLAIDQGPIVCMIENHRSGLLWDRFMRAPEVRRGLLKLGFTSPQLNNP